MSNDQNMEVLKSMKIDLFEEPQTRNSAQVLKESIKMSLACSDEVDLISEDISSPPRRTSDKNLNDYINFESADKAPEIIETVEKLQKKTEKDIFRVNLKDC